jgi:hypothetical protein
MRGSPDPLLAFGQFTPGSICPKMKDEGWC